MEKILEYWRLCELLDFKRFKLEDEGLEPFNTDIKTCYKKVKDEYGKKDSLSNNNVSFSNKTADIYKIYLGLVEEAKVIKSIYSALGKEPVMNDLEKFTSKKFTYLAYIFLDQNGNLISIDGTCLRINPIFSIVRSIVKLEFNEDTDKENELLELLNENFIKKHEVNKASKFIIIPDLERLIFYGQYKSPELFEFSEKENCELIIINEFIDEISKIANYNSPPKSREKNADNIRLKIIELKKESRDDIRFEDLKGKKLLEFGRKKAESNSADYIYIFHNKNFKFDDCEIPKNLYLINFYNAKQCIVPSVNYSGKVDKGTIEEMFEKIKEYLDFEDKYLHKDHPLYYKDTPAIYIKKYEDIKISKINNLPKEFGSFYLDALKESKKLTIPYIAGIKEEDKKNVNDDNEKERIKIRKEINSVDKFKSAISRWPSKYPLCYAQQAAVNLFLSKYNNPSGNIFSVNGPPGTGKTTLLKDVIANVITKRIDDFISSGDDKLFDDNHKLYDRYCSKYEIIVTSNNNNAVENLTSDLYKFDDKKDSFLLSDYAKIMYEKESFSLISAKLGKRENIESFCEKFKKIIKDIKKHQKNKDDKNILNKKIPDKETLLTRLGELTKTFKETKETIENYKIFKLSDEIKSNKDCIENIESRISLNEEKIRNLGFLPSLFKRKKYKILIDEKNELEKNKDKLKDDIKENQKELADLLQKFNSDGFYSKAEDEIQKSSLYNEKEFLKNKALLFKVSMQISEVLFLINLDNFENSIEFYLNNFFKKTLGAKEDLRKHFSAFSFVFPVISTSLASSYNMLKNIEEYGTLLCDEAGQATPQSLVGVLNRAKNALVVGDPLQVEPVFTAPDILIEFLTEKYKKYGINEAYSPLSTSAQRLADNANTFGSYYSDPNDKKKQLWVGMPLVVHRRCQEPMFSISNNIAYDDQMIKDINHQASKADKLPKSQWIDVKSPRKEDFIDNSSMEEIEELKKFIKKNKESLNNNYFIISPFKSIRDCDLDVNEDIVGTIHSFQGKEADVVFFVLGGSSDGAKEWASSKPNILNVAVTRAKKRIYFIGDRDAWIKNNNFNVANEKLKTSRPVNDIIK